ncbi:MAG TPA: glycosyltransferase family 4 protein [Gaiellaceae bacterium]
MRILVISNLYPPAVRGGYEVECAGVVRHLRERGDEVTVLTSRRGRGGSEDEGVLRLLPLLAQSPLGTLRAPLASFAAARTTRNVIASFRPDLIFAWNCAQIPHAAVYAALGSERPLAFRVCEHWFGRLFSGDQFARYLFPGDRGLSRAWAALVRGVNRRRVLRMELERAPFPVAISWNSRFIREAAPASPLLKPVHESIVLSTSLNGARFASVERRPGNETLICYAGRLSQEKGPEVAVRALALLRDRYEIEASLVLAGQASRIERRALADQAACLGVSDRCRMVGRLEPDALADLLARSHALVVPSLWAEPFPLITIEGALARVPIVASRTGGIPEQLKDGKQALLFPPGDAEACAEAIAQVLTRPAETTERVERAFERATSLSWESYLRETDTFVAESLAALTR